MTKEALADAAERVAFVAGYAAVSEAVIVFADAPQGWALVIMPVLAGIKAWFGTKVGDPNTASVRRKAAR